MTTRRGRVPGATYRVQLQPGFGFDAVTKLVPYLADLGVTHLYASPYLQAAPGSTHGYDVVDHARVNDELGGPDAHARLCDALASAGLGQVLDVVPNHMAITGRQNAWWWDVLENGPASVYASYFDVTWDPPEEKLRNTVLMPILGDHYGRVLEAGDLRVERDGPSFTIRYHDHVLPVAPRSLEPLLAAAARACDSDDLAFVAHSYGRLPPAERTDASSVRERHRDKAVLRRELARLCEERPEIAGAIDEMVAAINDDVDALDGLLDRQNYRVAYWRTAGQELDYRRFFDINTLIGLRIEDAQVFDDTHALVIQSLHEGVLDGLRIDHPDGLRDPEAYFKRLDEASQGAWVVAEKILEPDEHLPESWPIAGTTGYEFLNRVTGLLVDPAGEESLTQLYAAFTADSVDFADVAYEKKLLVLRDVLGADVNRLTALLVDVCERQRRYRDFTRHDLHEALREVTACFPVYRTYVRLVDGRPELSTDDVRYVGEAIEQARKRRPDLDGELLDFLGDLLLLKVGRGIEPELALRFQQLTPSAMAKGVEDTAFYTYCRFVALNEVGGSPGRFGVSIDEFHHANVEAQIRWPTTMLTTSTHDTKRSEDVRARLAVLSEIPDEWGDAVRRWTDMVDGHWPHGWPDRTMEYLLFQTLVGAWPLDRERAVAYMQKASKEAKDRTSWTNPDPEYDEALRTFVERIFDDEAFQADLVAFVEPLIWPGRVNSLSSQLLKLTSPGVPDLYQGTELWDLSLVDPDNRRPVDYELRRRLVRQLDGLPAEEVVTRADEGLPKLWLTRQTLALRRRRPDAFGPAATYDPLEARGSKADHVMAYARGSDRGAAVIAVLPRLMVRLDGDWAGTMLRLPEGDWRDVLTGDDVDAGVIEVARLLTRFPVALLERVDA